MLAQRTRCIALAHPLAVVELRPVGYIYIDLYRSLSLYIYMYIYIYIYIYIYMYIYVYIYI